MWIFMFLYMLSLGISQAAAQEKSTQMYYAKVKIDRSVLEYISQRLNFTPKDVGIEDVKITTECYNIGINKTCQCKPGHRWSDEACHSVSCCGQANCSLKNDLAYMCISNSTVDVLGKLKLEGDTYKECLTAQTTQAYQNCHDDLSKKMKMEYSKIRGYHNLTINNFSVGSIVVDFGMKIVSALDTQELLNRSTNLVQNLTGSLEMETTGLVSLDITRESVLYNNPTKIGCTTQEDFGAIPKWNLKRNDGEFLITNGTISTVLIEPKETHVNIKTVNELWQGEYICLFVQEQNTTTIKHKANGTLDVCLLPKIEISADPEFPLCIKETNVFLVKVKCEIKNTDEEYTVKWDDGAIEEPKTTEGDKVIYKAKKLVDCKKNSNSSSASAEVSCTFTNECKQTRTEKMRVEVIYVEDKYCPANGDWGDTKAGFDSKIKCKDQAGARKRKCSSTDGYDRTAKWEEEVSECIEKELFNVLERANISDIGLGELEANAAKVFKQFEQVTKTKKLPGYANIDTSVKVLSTMDKKLNSSSLKLQDAINDFLWSSSHLLNDSLKKYWIERPPEWPRENSTMAERFMLSVENLIGRADIMKKTIMDNLEVAACNISNCSFSVLDAKVYLPDGGVVKTAAFKHLESFLHNDTNKSEISSIIVSTTATIKTNITITIDFNVTKQRPRNVELYCVFWDINLHKFSRDGCQWDGPRNGGRCVCNHLSSFAILMSKEPLEVPGLTYVTYAVLSISVLSLIINLVIELIVWSEVVKTNTLYLRHTAHVNISLCLLIGNLSFLASSSNPKGISDLWCRTSVVLKHFSYLAMFFWMLCLSVTLLHQAVFLFHQVSKKNYLRFSLVVGYFCPLLIVFITFLTNDGGAEGKYYTKDTCWLVYDGFLKGTFFTFFIPVGAIVFINVFSMLVVIMKLISHHSELHQKTDISPEKEKAAAKTVVRSVILLTPIFGVTWMFGFAFLVLDLTEGPVAYAVSYIFTLLNGLQGLFILLTTCFGDRMTREALRNYFKKKSNAPTTSVSSSTLKLDSTCKN